MDKGNGKRGNTRRDGRDADGGSNELKGKERWCNDVERTIVASAAALRRTRVELVSGAKGEEKECGGESPHAA